MILRQTRRRNGYPATAGRALYDPRHADACIAALTGDSGGGIDRGTSGYLSYPDSASLEYRDGQTLMAECWICVQSYPGGTAAIISKGGNPGNQPNWCLLLETAGTVGALVGASSWYFVMACSSTQPLPLKTWTHIRLTIVSNTMRIFVNGVLVASASGTGAQVDAQPLTVGGGSGYATVPGLIDGVHIRKGGSYDTASFTPPSAVPVSTADTVLINTAWTAAPIAPLPVVNRASQVGKALALQGGAAITTQSRFDGGALSGGYLEIPHHTDFDYTDMAALMAECCIYVDSYPTATAAIFSKGGYPGNQPNWCLLIQPSGVLTGIVGASSYYPAMSCDTGAPVPLRAWLHVRMTILPSNPGSPFDKSSKIRIFVGGVLSATSSGGTGAETDAQPLTVGGGSGHATFPGLIDGVHIRKGGSYDTASFTPPSAAPTLTNDTILLLNFDGGTAGALMEGIRWSQGGSGVAVSGMQAHDYATSLRFSGGYLQHLPSTLFNLAGTDWTIKAVVRWDGGAGGLWSRRNNQVGHGACGGILADGRVFLAGVWNSAWRDPWLASATAIVPDVWTPIAWVRRGPTVTIAINSVESASGTLTAEPVDQPSIPFAVGAGGSYGESPFRGWVQDFVFLRGVGETPADLAQAIPYRDRIRRPPGVVTLVR